MRHDIHDVAGEHVPGPLLQPDHGAEVGCEGGGEQLPQPGPRLPPLSRPQLRVTAPVQVRSQGVQAAAAERDSQVQVAGGEQTSFFFIISRLFVQMKVSIVYNMQNVNNKMNLTCRIAVLHLMT